MIETYSLGELDTLLADLVELGAPLSAALDGSVLVDLRGGNVELA